MRRLLFAVVAVVGCNPATLKHTPDGPAVVIDASPDAPDHGPVSVKVFDPNTAGAIVVGAPVLFFEADGTLVGTPLTDASGIATANVHYNANVTAIVSASGQTSVMTVYGVKPGDTINLDSSQATTQDPPFTVSFPSYTGATNYTVYGPCGSTTGSGSVALPMASYCELSTMDLIVVANDANFNPMAYLEKPNVPYTAGGNTAIIGSYVLPSTFNASYSDIDASITTLSMTRTVPGEIGFGRNASGAPANGTLLLSAPALTAQTATVLTRAQNAMDLEVVQQNLLGNALTYSLDIGATLLPWVGPVTFDLGAKTITPMTDMTGTTHDAPDAFTVNFFYSRPGGSGTLSYRWTIIAPTVANITLPALPSAMNDVVPLATDTLGPTSSIALESPSMTWDMLRTDFNATINGLGKPDSSTELREAVFQTR